MIILDFYTKNHEQSNIRVATIANELLRWDKLPWDKLLIKPSRYGTIDNMQDNITFLHLHCNFPDISHIHHLCHWFQPIGFVPIPQHVKKDLLRQFWKKWGKYCHSDYILSSLCILNVWSSQPAITCPKLTIEILKQDVKCVQS